MAYIGIQSESQGPIKFYLRLAFVWATMIPNLPYAFIGISIVFLCLAIASYVMEQSIKRDHVFLISVLKKEREREEKGETAVGWSSIEGYFYKTIGLHRWLEIAGFLVAAFAAVVEWLVTAG